MADCLRIGIELAFWSRIGGVSLDLIIEFKLADWGWIGLEYGYLLWIALEMVDWQYIGKLVQDWQIEPKFIMD